MAKKSKKKKTEEIQEEVEVKKESILFDEEDAIEDDPFLEKVTLIFLLIFLICVIFIPGEWFNSLSMWVRNYIPGIK